jgi:hypothetical protein
MTEDEWTGATRPEHLLDYLEGMKQLDKRKARLFGVACCRRIWHIMVDERSRRAVELGELRADGLVPWREVESYAPIAYQACRKGSSHTAPAEYAAFSTTAKKIRPGYISWLTRHAVVRDLNEPGYTAGHDREAIPELSLLYDIFGNPFRPVMFDPSWRTSTAVELARQMDESRGFDRMPILADALEDAGCDDPQVLAHCRGDGPHVRGCWVVDLVLGKA